MATVWGQLIVPPTNDPMRPRVQGVEFWLAQEFRKNTSYRDIVRQALDPVVSQASGQFAPFALFLQANEFKPENLAASTSRLFLGVKLECAQCHDHPFQGPTNAQQFWEFASLFRRHGSRPGHGQSRPPAPRLSSRPPARRCRLALFSVQAGNRSSSRIPTRARRLDRMASPLRTIPGSPARRRQTACGSPSSALASSIRSMNPATKTRPAIPSFSTSWPRPLSPFTITILKYLIKSLMLTRAYQRSSRQTETPAKRTCVPLRPHGGARA